MGVGGGGVEKRVVEGGEEEEKVKPDGTWSPRASAPRFLPLKVCMRRLYKKHFEAIS